MNFRVTIRTKKNKNKSKYFIALSVLVNVIALSRIALVISSIFRRRVTAIFVQHIASGPQ